MSDDIWLPTTPWPSVADFASTIQVESSKINGPAASHLPHGASASEVSRGAGEKLLRRLLA